MCGYLLECLNFSKMSKTWKDKSDKYKKEDLPKKKEGRRFVSSKGRKDGSNLKDLLRKGYNLDDYLS